MLEFNRKDWENWSLKADGKHAVLVAVAILLVAFVAGIITGLIFS